MSEQYDGLTWKEILIRLKHSETQYTETQIHKIYAEFGCLRARIAELEEANRWIPVRERLPEALVYVLFVVNKIEIKLGYHSENYHEWRTGDSNYAESEVAHWRPLPQPPEGDA